MRIRLGQMDETLTVIKVTTGTSADGVTANTEETIATLPAHIRQTKMTVVHASKAQDDFDADYIAVCSNHPDVKANMDVRYRDKLLWIGGMTRDERNNQMKLFLALRSEAAPPPE